MANNLTVATAALPTPFLPRRVDAVARCVGTVKHQDAKTRYHLPVGWTMDEEVRAEAKNQLSTLTSLLDPAVAFLDQDGGEAKLALVTTLLIGSASAQNSEAAADARFDLFECALDDVPAWAVAEAIGMWAKGECPKDIEENPKFAFAPAPATLRKLAKLAMKPYLDSVALLERVVLAETMDDAMDPTKEAPTLALEKPKSMFALRKM